MNYKQKKLENFDDMFYLQREGTIYGKNGSRVVSINGLVGLKAIREFYSLTIDEILSCLPKESNPFAYEDTLSQDRAEGKNQCRKEFLDNLDNLISRK